LNPHEHLVEGVGKHIKFVRAGGGRAHGVVVTSGDRFGRGGKSLDGPQKPVLNSARDQVGHGQGAERNQ
jgi:hypothetical protein